MSDSQTASAFESQSASASQSAFQEIVNRKIIEDLLSRISRCHSIGELLKTVPAPAQEATKPILEKTTEAFSRKGACETILNSWKDARDKAEYDRVHELNFLKAPSVQCSKLAMETNENALNAHNFTSAIGDAKKAFLDIMISKKEQEVTNLEQLCNDDKVKKRVHETWKAIGVDEGITPEHMTILLNSGCAERLALMATSIGINTLTRTANLKKKKLEKKKETDIEMTNVADNPKSMNAWFHEMMKRERQSEKDKKISKKGSGRAGPPKTPKNPKNRAAKVQKKGPQQRNAKKVGTSTKRRQGKR